MNKLIGLPDNLIFCVCGHLRRPLKFIFEGSFGLCWTKRVKTGWKRDYEESSGMNE
jgi:hypothetical protein